MYRSSWCEIDVAQFRRNLEILRRIAATRMLLVVKANAYGHGLIRMAIEAEAAGIDMLGVATIGEADQLIKAGVRTPILIMCALDSEEIDYCVAHGVHFLAWRRDHFETAIGAAAKHQQRPYAHLEVDTGMSRSGVNIDDFETLLDGLSPGMLASIVGIASHFASADLEVLTTSERQLADFLACVALAEKAGLQLLIHLANSPGALRLADSRMGMVRMGIAAYGLPPSEHTALPEGVAPILTWKAAVTNVKEVPPGQGVGYAWRYIAQRHERVATIAIGYADGFRRYPGGINLVLLGGGISAPVVGSIFMDQCLVRVPEGVPCAVGDVIVLLGQDSETSFTAEDLALRWGTNNYDVVSGIRSRVPRRYMGSE